MNSPISVTKSSLLTGALAILCTLSARGESPRWEDFEKLLGRPVASQEVQVFVRTYHLNQSSTNATGGFSNLKETPFMVIYRTNKVSEVEVAVWKYSFLGVPPYAGALPHGLKSADTLDTIIQRLGAPGEKKTHDNMVYAYYPKLRLGLSFDGPSRVLRSVSLHAE